MSHNQLQKLRNLLFDCRRFANGCQLDANTPTRIALIYHEHQALAWSAYCETLETTIKEAEITLRRKKEHPEALKQATKDLEAWSRIRKALLGALEDLKVMVPPGTGIPTTAETTL
jgi:hypothetical protein